MFSYFVDPLEQFNILVPFSLTGLCSIWSLDLISLINLFNISFLALYIFILSKLKMDTAFSYIRYSLGLLEKLKKKVIHSNLLIKKQLFICFFIIIFFFVLLSNFLGMIPYSSTPTSFFAVTFFLAAIVFLASTFTGIKIQKLGLLKALLPGGVPIVISIGLVPIEIISYFSKLLSLSIRLFANMMSGHTLLKILIGFAWVIIQKGSAYLFFSIPPLLIILSVTSLECMIALLQAYIFIVLSSIYFNDVINMH